MSDSSSLSGSQPSAAAIEEALRTVVRNIYATGNLDELTVKRVRSAAETRLNLQKDFFKDNPSWNDRSKSVIQIEVEAHPEPASSQASPPKKPSQTESPATSAKASTSKPRTTGQKRASTEALGTKKRRKTDDEDIDASSSESRRIQLKGSNTKRKQPQNRLPSPGQDRTNAIRRDQAEEEVLDMDGVNPVNSESDMSVLIDEDPKPKAKRRSGGSGKAKPKKSGAPKASKPEVTADPHMEEIKRLQGWLVKCGIRKMWWKELQPYDTPKAKIRHLKDMLSDAGMTGRYSNEKASQIKEEREFKADLEAVQAGNRQWGKAGSEDEGTARPKRKLARGLESLDFLNDEDGEETD